MEARRIQIQQARRSRLEQVGAHTAALGEGAGEAALSLLTWAKDVAEVALIQQQYYRHAKTLVETYWQQGAPWDDPNQWQKRYQRNLADNSFHGELIDVLGFDVRRFSAEEWAGHLAAAYEVAVLIEEDEPTRSMRPRRLSSSPSRSPRFEDFPLDTSKGATGNEPKVVLDYGGANRSPPTAINPNIPMPSWPNWRNKAILATSASKHVLWKNAF